MSLPLIYKNGWELRITAGFSETNPKYEICSKCLGTGRIVDQDTDELWKFDPPMKRCDKCFGDQNFKIDSEFPKPEVPAELIKRLRCVIREFGKEYNDPSYKEPFKHAGDNI